MRESGELSGACEGELVALAYLERGNELGFGVNRAERPDIAQRRIVVNLALATLKDSTQLAVLFLLADKSPEFVKLQVIAR